MKKVLSSLLLAVVLALSFTAFTANASVETSGISVDWSTGDVTVVVDATEPWTLWRTTDFVTWEKIKTQGVGRHVYVDKGILFQEPWAFYKATPVRKSPK